MAARKKSTRYGKTAGKKVEAAMEERKHGTLRSGGSGRKVTSKKQAIAIALSEARAAGGKVPPNPNAKKNAAKSAAKRKSAAGRKTSAKKSTAKKTSGRKTPARKAAAKKTSAKTTAATASPAKKKTATRASR